MKLEILSGPQVQSGDVVLGVYAPDAPTTPVQLMAFGLTLHDMRFVYDIENGRLQGVVPTWAGGLVGNFLPINHKFFVLR